MYDRPGGQMSQAKDRPTTATDRAIAVATAAAMCLGTGACLELAQAHMDQPSQLSQGQN